MKFRRSLLGALGLALLAGSALAAGVYTNGLPTLQPPGTTGSIANFGTSYAVYPLTGSELFPVDTQLANGLNPQSEAVSISQAKLYVPTPATLTDAASIATDSSTADFYQVTLAGNRTLANPTNLVAGKKWQVEAIQDGTGSRTLAYGTLYKWTGGTAPTLSTTSQSKDLLTFIYDGSVILGSSNLNMK